MKQRANTGRQLEKERRYRLIACKYDTLRRVMPEASNQRLIILLADEMKYDPVTIRKALYSAGRISPRVSKQNLTESIQTC